MLLLATGMHQELLCGFLQQTNERMLMLLVVISLRTGYKWFFVILLWSSKNGHKDPPCYSCYSRSCQWGPQHNNTWTIGDCSFINFKLFCSLKPLCWSPNLIVRILLNCKQDSGGDHLGFKFWGRTGVPQGPTSCQRVLASGGIEHFKIQINPDTSQPFIETISCTVMKCNF